MPKNYCIMQIWAESGKSALPICNYSQILYQFLTFTQNLKRSPAVTQPLENLKTLIIAVIGAVGVIILAKNVMEFAQAYQQQDSSTMNSALKGIVAGVMMAGISTVLTFLGF